MVSTNPDFLAHDIIWLTTSLAKLQSRRNSVYLV